MDTQQFLQLRPGKKYTIWFFSEFGFPCTAHIKLQSVKVEQYLNYQETVTMLFIPKENQVVKTLHILPGRVVAIWPSWLSVDAEKYAKDTPDINAAIKSARVRPIALNVPEKNSCGKTVDKNLEIML